MSTTTSLSSPLPTATSAVTVSGLHKSFGDVHAVNGLSLQVSPGEVVAFLGPNGAGKSTTLDIIMGFSSQDAGTVTVLDSTPAQAVSAGRIGAILQDGGLIPSFTVRETLEVIGSLQRHRPDIETIIDRTDLRRLLRRKVSKLSGGERQRLRLALALLPDPELLILDEPTTGLDVTARANFWSTMRELTSDGHRTVIFATHYLQEAADFADRIIIIDQGQLVAEGTIDELRARQDATSVTAQWPGLDNEATLARALEPVADSIRGLHVLGEHLEVLTSDADQVARLLLTTTPACHLAISAPTLDEIFSGIIANDASEA